MSPTKISKRVPLPKRTRHATPQYPVIPPETTTKGGPWIGEVLVDQQGSVVEVWTIRDVGFNPPFPAFNRAIVDAPARTVRAPRCKRTARAVVHHGQHLY